MPAPGITFTEFLFWFPVVWRWLLRGHDYVLVFDWCCGWVYREIAQEWTSNIIGWCWINVVQDPVDLTKYTISVKTLALSFDDLTNTLKLFWWTPCESSVVLPIPTLPDCYDVGISFDEATSTLYINKDTPCESSIVLPSSWWTYTAWCGISISQANEISVSVDHSVVCKDWDIQLENDTSTFTDYIDYAYKTVVSDPFWTPTRTRWWYPVKDEWTYYAWRIESTPIDLSSIHNSIFPWKQYSNYIFDVDTSIINDDIEIINAETTNINIPDWIKIHFRKSNKDTNALIWKFTWQDVVAWTKEDVLSFIHSSNDDNAFWVKRWFLI